MFIEALEYYLKFLAGDYAENCDKNQFRPNFQAKDDYSVRYSISDVKDKGPD